MFWSGWYKKSWGRWINRLKDKALSKSFSNISKIYLKKISTKFLENIPFGVSKHGRRPQKPAGRPSKGFGPKGRIIC